MTKKKVGKEFRSRLSEKLMDLGNLIVVTLAIGQFVTNNNFSFTIFISGIILTILCYIISYVISD